MISFHACRHIIGVARRARQAWASRVERSGTISMNSQYQLCTEYLRIKRPVGVCEYSEPVFWRAHKHNEKRNGKQVRGGSHAFRRKPKRSIATSSSRPKAPSHSSVGTSITPSLSSFAAISPTCWSKILCSTVSTRSTSRYRT